MIGNIIGKVVSKVVAAVPKMVNAVKRAVNKVSTAIRKVVSAVPKVVNAARDKIATKVEKVKKQLYDTAKEKGPQLLEKVMDIGNKNQRILDNIKQAWENTGLNRGTVTIGAILFDGRVPFKMFDFVLKSRRAIVEEYPFLNRNLDLVKDKYKRLQEVGTKVKHSIGNYLYELNIPFVSEYASVVYDVRRGSESNIVTILGSFGKGIADGVIGTIDGIGSVITDPIGTLEGVNTILAYPEIVIPVIGKEIKKGWDDKIVNGSAEDRANIVGYITFEVGAYLITKPAKLGKVADNVGDVGRVADNVGDVGRLADNVGDVGRVVDNVGDVGRLADNVGDAGRLVDNAGDVGRVADNVADAGKIPDMARTADNIEDWYDLTKNSIMKSDNGGSGVRISGAVDEKAIGKVADSAADARKVGVVDDVVEGANKINIPTEGAGKANDIGYMKNAADPMRDVLGPGRTSNPKEWNAIIKELEASGVEINYSKGSMAYAPGLQKGNPGQIKIDPDASLSALKHEYQHFLDAKVEGFPSFGQQMFENPNSRVIKELRAYMVEIKEADKMGLKDVAEQLFENYRQEREWIVNQYILPGGE